MPCELVGLNVCPVVLSIKSLIIRVLTIKLLHCSSCFRYLENETQYVKKAIIGKHLYGFCHEECYNEWLKNPQYKFLGKIN